MTPSFDMDLIMSQLTRSRHDDEPLRFASAQRSGAPSLDEHPWLAQSHADPAAFRAALIAHYRRAAPQLKSHPAQGYDLYHDLILRHAGSDALAFLHHERRRGLVPLRYAELHERSGALAATWAARGATPGAVACLIAPMGPDLLVALAAGLRLGLTLALLPPAGPRFLARRLAALEPELLLTTPALAPQLHGLPAADHILRSDAASMLGPRAGASFSYAPGAPALLLLSPLCEGELQPVALSAEAVFGAALRDALLVLALRPRLRFAALGLHLQRHQPLLLLTSLLAGASYVHLESDDLRAEPVLLATAETEVLLLAPPALAALPEGGLGLSQWFLSLGQASDWRREPPPALRRSSGAHLSYDAAAGGCLLWSARQRLAPLPVVLPAPGMKAALQDAGPLRQSATGAVGLLTNELMPQGHLVLARHQGAYLFAGSLGPRREGRVYPADEVAAVAETLPFVVGAAVTPVLVEDVYAMVLCLFTGGEEAAETERQAAARTELLRSRLRLQLGDEFLPDTMVFYPIYPRRSEGPEGPVDSAWVRGKYQTGALERMASRPVFHTLAALRQWCLDPSGLLRRSTEEKA